MVAKSRLTLISNVKRTIGNAIPALGSGGRRIIEGILDDAGRQATILGREIIETTPSSIVPGKPDRVDTGLMRDSVNYMVTHSGRNRYNLYAGWIDGDAGYFELQDVGGTTSWGVEIEGMFMMDRIKQFLRPYVEMGISDAIHG